MKRQIARLKENFTEQILLHFYASNYALQHGLLEIFIPALKNAAHMWRYWAAGLWKIFNFLRFNCGSSTNPNRVLNSQTVGWVLVFEWKYSMIGNKVSILMFKKSSWMRAKLAFLCNIALKCSEKAISSVNRKFHGTNTSAFLCKWLRSTTWLTRNFHSSSQKRCTHVKILGCWTLKNFQFFAFQLWKLNQS